MAVPLAQLRLKALGFVDSINKMTQKERERYPTGIYADDYNRLRGMVVESKPELTELLPPEAEIMDNELYGKLSRQRFNEIGTFCQQIVNFLS